MAGEQEKSKISKAGGALAKAKEKFLHNDGFFFTLLRSSVSSQICGWIDTIISFLAFSLCGLTPFLSTAIGAFIGGIMNLTINYRFTFHAYNVDWRSALAKYIFVWVGSLLLNSFGTQIAYHAVRGWHWLHEVTHIADDGIFLGARLFVALMVSLCWNFLLQRNFVFKVTRLDPYINRALDRLGIPSSKTKSYEATPEE